jgi:putative endonuclease
MNDFSTYVLVDDAGRLYKGCTNDLARRVKEHRSGKTATTRKGANWRVCYAEKFATLEEARLREKYFKTAAGRRFLKRKIVLST